MVLATAVGEKGIVIWRAALSALCAGLIGIGFARFAYSPLIPALIAERWFSPAQAAYLGAANLAGYLVGALIAGRMNRAASAATVLRAMMLLATASFFACAYPLPFTWFFAWRFAAGIAGGVLMVLAALAVLPHVPAGQRGLVGGAIFSGVGLGVAASGTLVPLLMRLGLSETWISFGLMSLALTIVAWTGWPRDPPAHRAAEQVAAAASKPRANRAFLALCAEYALNAVGLVPHMVFLVDFVARGLGRGLAAGGFYWTTFGIGAVAGPLLTGAIADRIGFRQTLQASFLVQAAAVAAPAIADGPIALVISSAVVGLFVPGVVPLVLGRMHELVHEAQARQKAWSWCTTAFAVGQATAAYGFSYLFAQTGGAYALLFALAAAALLIAFVLDLAQGAESPRHWEEKAQS
jgi:predicted MFS family arabinose efflux permease